MKTLRNVILFGSAVALMSGCASNNATYVESGGARSVISTNKINIADWNNAAASLVNDLLSSGALEKTGEKQPMKLLVSRVSNNTSDVIDVDMLTKKICIALNSSGKARAITKDQASADLLRYKAEMSGKKIGMPKITLTGKIMEDRESNSDVREVTYTFFLDVNYDGTAIWSGEKQITKQQEKSSFGF